MSKYAKVQREKSVNFEELTRDEIEKAVKSYYYIANCPDCQQDFRVGGLVDNDNNYVSCPECDESYCIPR